ncbi:type II restriction enzyme NlaIII [Helicobacter pylori Hp H-45]|uniref:Type II restriction enzyme NlaIII n=1 Tax=Helicobacter pylori Hp H-45 TaxID=992050 RepID=J0LYG1_HELPX|nr:type II restriction enzyme NlaIII [Helicobacter pylori Hp H-45]
MCGTRGNSENTQIEVDHKDGRKDDPRVSDSNAQTFDDFQALCKACNDKKRQVCKECKETDHRFKATKIPGNRYLFMRGRLNMMAVWVAINMTPYNTGKLVMIGYTMKGIKKAMVMGIKLDTIKKLLYSGCNELHRF